MRSLRWQNFHFFSFAKTKKIAICRCVGKKSQASSQKSTPEQLICSSWSGTTIHNKQIKVCCKCQANVLIHNIKHSLSAQLLKTCDFLSEENVFQNIWAYVHYYTFSGEILTKMLWQHSWMVKTDGCFSSVHICFTLVSSARTLGHCWKDIYWILDCNTSHK